MLCLFGGVCGVLRLLVRTFDLLRNLLGIAAATDRQSTTQMLTLPKPKKMLTTPHWQTRLHGSNSELKTPTTPPLVHDGSPCWRLLWLQLVASPPVALANP